MLNLSNIRKVSGLLLIMILLLSSLLQPAVAAQPVKHPRDFMVFDLKQFLQSMPNSQTAYDYLKLASALQGLANRNQANLYYLYESNSVAQEAGMDMDRFWLEELQKKGNYLAKRNIVEVEEFTNLLDLFSRDYKGVVVWDPEVPATANVASTIAGVERWLPVRYDTAEGSAWYELVVERQLPVKLDLVGMFNGTGMIPDTPYESTGSAKNDAYLWAKHHYLDRGKTNRTLMAYALDGVSWDFDEQKHLNAQLVSMILPKKMLTGQTIEVSFVLRNNGAQAWEYHANDRLATTGDGANEFVWSNLNGGYSQSPDNARVFLDVGEIVEPGAERTFTFTITAPENEGSYTFSAQMVRDGVAYYGPVMAREIEVTTDPSAVEPPVPEAGSDEEYVYPDLFNSFLPNADYFIAKKAFFFDLSPDQHSLPNDDREQELGTDYNTLIELLRSQNRLARKNIITIGGFVPWWLKYTNHADAEARLTPVQAEWKYADEISKYNAQKDADAFGLVGLSNASVFQHVRLDRPLKQKNDKGNNGKQYDPNKTYITFYMGDYDSGAWTSGALPALWNDPMRGELPLAWAPVPGLSERVPHVFNYLYETMTPNDYFVAGDNGAGYLNPHMLLEDHRPDGLPDFLNVWERYNRKYYRTFDLDITGFLISGNSGYASLPVQEAYSRFSPLGVGNNAGFEQPIVNGTPFVQVIDLPNVPAQQLTEVLADRLSGNQQFHMFRTILYKPSTIVEAVNGLQAAYPEIDFEVIDPYTFFRFYKEAELWEQSGMTYVSPKRSVPISVDGVISPGEWESASSLELSATSSDVQQYGTIWGEAGNLQSHIRLQWDENYLYLLEERLDEQFQFTQLDNELYLSDAGMLFLSLDGVELGSVYRDGDYAVIFSASSQDSQPKVILREGREQGAVEYALPEALIASTITDDTFILELAIPWSALQTVPFAPQQGKSIGMSVLVTHGPDNWGQIMWVGNGDDQANWATMLFGGNTP